MEIKKSLKTKIVATVVLTIIGFWVISGILARKHAASFFAEHESRLQQRGKQGEVLDELRLEKRSLIREVAGIRVVMFSAAVITLSIALGLMWRRRVLSRYPCYRIVFTR